MAIHLQQGLKSGEERKLSEERKQRILQTTQPFWPSQSLVHSSKPNKIKLRGTIERGLVTDLPAQPQQ